MDKVTIPGSGATAPQPAEAIVPPDRGRPLYGRVKNQMVDTVTIRNFRSFDEAKIEDLRRVNVLVGENGSGKTALLEAIFMAGGVSPEIAMRTRSWRGSETAAFQGSQEDLYEALWGDLFHKFQSNSRPLATGRGVPKKYQRSVDCLG